MELTKRFKQVEGGYVDVISHTLDIMKKHPMLTIHIGTDSQTDGDITTYVTVIAYRYTNNGVHYIYTKNKLPRINDLWTRLWKEAEMSIEVAEWFTSQVNIKVEIDMDYNQDKFWKSNQLIQAAQGWANSLGYKTNTKPDILVASRAADYHTR